MVLANIRIARSSDLPRVRRAYEEWGYKGAVEDDDVVYMAEANGALIGVVRRTHEHGAMMLRGMQVAPASQRRGIGSSLLSAFTSDLDMACYCVPYSRLISFYAAAGFVPITDTTAPAFLQARLREYRSTGLDVLVMHRPADHKNVVCP